MYFVSVLRVLNLQDADEIIVLKSGKIEEKGSFQHLMKNGMDFSAFLAEESKEETEEDSDVKKKNLRNRTMSLTSDTHSEMSTTNPHNSVTIQTVIEEEEADTKKTEAEKLDKDPKQVGNITSRNVFLNFEILISILY